MESLNAHTPPDLTSTQQQSFTDWISANSGWFTFAIAILLGVVLLVWILKNNQPTKKLQRDALEKMRKSLIASCRYTRGPARRLVLTGGARQPLAVLGRYKGHYLSVECVWFAYKPRLFSKTRLLCVNPVDVASYDSPEIHIRGVGVHQARDITFATPDTHNPSAREDWRAVTGRAIDSPEDFAEAVKTYYATCVDNALSFYDSLNAAEDRSFLRQEVTRSQDELTETLTVPAQPLPKENTAVEE